jgi:hypothetical protein
MTHLHFPSSTPPTLHHHQLHLQLLIHSNNNINKMTTEGTTAPVHSTETDKMVNSIPDEKKNQEGGEGGEAETGEKRKAEDVKVIGGDDNKEGDKK